MGEVADDLRDILDRQKFEDLEAKPKPFLKWAGGKRQLLPELLKHVPKKFGTYYEPFVGGGALFFTLHPSSAKLGDVNSFLIRSYRGIRDDLALTIENLRAHERLHSARYFNQLRLQSHPSTSMNTRIHIRNDAGVAAWMIYLNKTCFNGLWRVNKSGMFNVPFGRYENPTICDDVGLRFASEALSGVELVTLDFAACCVEARKGDFVYFDPPYIPASATANFTGYTKGGFGVSDQIRLRDFALKMKKRGVHVLLSNSDTPATRKLYEKGFELRSVSARRAINSKGGKRGAVGELLIW